MLEDNLRKEFGDKNFKICLFTINVDDCWTLTFFDLMTSSINPPSESRKFNANKG